MSSTVNLGRIFGIQFRLHFSWFIIFALVTAFLSWQVFPPALSGQSQLAYWTMGAVTSLLFFASVVAHELAHGLVGRANGITIKSITLFIFGGAAHMTREPSQAAQELRMAIAGPVSSLVIAGLFWAASNTFNGTSPQLALMALWLAQINLVLAVFNLFPGFPLDGGRILRAIVWRFSGYKKATRIATQAGRVVGYLFVLGGVAIIIVDQNWLSGVWLGLIGLFLESTARASYKQAMLQQVLQGMTAAEVMLSGCRRVPRETTVSELATEYGDSDERCFIVADEGRAEGIITLHNIASVAKSEKDSTRLGQIARPLETLPTARLGDDVLGIVQHMNESGHDEVAVMEQDGLVGLITMDSLIELVNRHPDFKT
jgi:Zn-dependent protease/CBS domain-containing protein